MNTFFMLVFTIFQYFVDYTLQCNPLYKVLAKKTDLIASERNRIIPANDTTLKGNYRLLTKTDSNYDYLILTKGKFKKQISVCSKNLPRQNLGYVLLDFEKAFVLGKSFGGGNPTQVELIEKANGTNKLDPDAIWIGSNVSGNIFFYSTEIDNKIKLIKIVITNYSKQTFSLPTKITEQPGWFYRMKIEKIVGDGVRISMLENGAKRYHNIR